MAIDESKIVDMRLKHLEMVQTVVTRIAGQGATLKNYCITLTTAVCGLAFTLQKPALALLSLFPIVIFWFLDTQYLRVERRLRAHFDLIRHEDWAARPSLQIIPTTCLVSLWSVAGSWSILSFYFPLALGVVMVVLAGSYYVKPI